MSHKAAKIGLTSLVLALAFGGLLYTTLGESTEYDKHVDEVMAQPDAVARQAAAAPRLRRSDIRRKRDIAGLPLRGPAATGRSCRAYYTGIVPDTFKDDSEVVLQGTLDAGRLSRDQTDDGEVPVEVRAEGESAQRDPDRPRTEVGRWPPSVTTSCSPPSSSARTRAAISVAGARRRSRALDRKRHRRLLSRRRHHDGRLGGHRLRLRHRRLLDQVRRSTTRTPPSRSSTRSRRTGAGSTARSCSGCSCCRSSAATAVYVNRERHRELIPYVVAIISVVRDVLPVPDGRPQQPVRDLPHGEPDRRRGSEPAAAELLHGDSPADHVHWGSSA